MDETWAHHFDLEMKSSSMQWKTPSSPTPKKARVVSVPSEVIVRSRTFEGQRKVAEMCRYAG